MYNSWCPESLRWLMSTGRYHQANKLLGRAAKLNKKSLPPNPLGTGEDDIKKDGGDTDDALEHEQKKVGKANFLEYIKSPRPRRYFFIMMYLV